MFDYKLGIDEVFHLLSAGIGQNLAGKILGVKGQPLDDFGVY